MADRRFVLAIDGGGIRGIIPSLLLAEIERCTENRIAKLFDLIGATSTGGLLALGLTAPDDNGQPRYTADQLRELYREEGPRIFHQSWLWKIRALGGIAEQRYDEGPLETILRERYFGDTPMSQALTEVILTSYDLYESQPFIFKRSYARTKPEWDYPMWWVARSTSAAPTYFDPFEITARLPDEPDHVLVDGGLFANNPSLCAYVEALDAWGPDAEIVLCSVGTGEKRRRGLTKREADGWGAARWAPVILDTVFDGVSDAVDYQMRILCRQLPQASPRYRRFQIRIPDDMSAALDNVEPNQLRRLEELGRRLVDLNAAELADLCAQLQDRPAAPVPA